jgi:hypothetical protein
VIAAYARRLIDSATTEAPVTTRPRALVRPPWTKTLDLACLASTIVLLGWIFYRNAYLDSKVIDGIRYFLLDDDMMISMRYGRNLAEGHGLVWNAGEHVEGYTNFLWTIVMAGAHFLPVPDHKMALVIKGIGFTLLCGSFYLALKMLRELAPRSFLATPLLLIGMFMCVDIVHWSTWGFETSLMTFLDMLVLLRLMQGKQDLLCFVALSLVPLVRGDGLHVFAANAFLALVLSERPLSTARRLSFAVIPFVAHIAFRRVYYGDWLPNTYYLKVYLLDDVRHRGALYARGFLMTYAVLLTLATGAALMIARRDKRALVYFVSLVGTLGYVVNTGGDMFGNFRFCAHLMPIVFVFAASGVALLGRRTIPKLVWAGVFYLVSVPLLHPFDRLVFLDGNGDPMEQIQVAMLMKKNAKPTSSVAVITAGILPYFNIGMRAIDILGKSDKQIAKMKPFPGAMVGHGKQDPRHTLLDLKPDLVVSCRSNPWAMTLARDTRTTDPVLSFLASGVFMDHYRLHYVTENFTFTRTAVYTYPGSPEWANRTNWKPITVSP